MPRSAAQVVAHCQPSAQPPEAQAGSAEVLGLGQGLGLQSLSLAQPGAELRTCLQNPGCSELQHATSRSPSVMDTAPSLVPSPECQRGGLPSFPWQERSCHCIGGTVQTRVWDRRHPKQQDTALHAAPMRMLRLSPWTASSHAAEELRDGHTGLWLRPQIPNCSFLSVKQALLIHLPCLGCYRRPWMERPAAQSKSRRPCVPTAGTPQARQRGGLPLGSQSRSRLSSYSSRMVSWGLSCGKGKIQTGPKDKGRMLSQVQL